MNQAALHFLCLLNGPAELAAWRHAQLSSQVCRHAQQQDVHDSLDEAILLDGAHHLFHVHALRLLQDQFLIERQDVNPALA
uniref:Putative secreted protein n=1 Tax=Ixodes ricinus TaxID=34613 RepID=A0A6B0U6H6_IXORI